MLDLKHHRSDTIRRSAAGVQRRALLDEFSAAYAKHETERALKLAQRLELLEPQDPRWPHKRGDLLRAVRRLGEAESAYHHAARLYRDLNLLPRATAMLAVARSMRPAALSAAPPSEAE